MKKVGDGSTFSLTEFALDILGGKFLVSYVIGNFHTLAAVSQASAKFKLTCYELGGSYETSTCL